MRLHSIHTCQSCGACRTGELTRGGGEVGGGGEEHFPRTEVIEGEGDRTRVEAANAFKAAVLARICAQ